MRKKISNILFLVASVLFLAAATVFLLETCREECTYLPYCLASTSSLIFFISAEITLKSN
ncbi:MAG: hypothetical protein HFJ40_04295 [Clostridia bacterium]|nr:hypothetical protein [Clostridia bacterium]